MADPNIDNLKCPDCNNSARKVGRLVGKHFVGQHYKCVKCGRVFQL